jgi:hypothetical protein
MSSKPAVADERTRLEPVTCWPLILGAAGFAGAGVLVIAGLALWTALRPRPAPVARAAPPARAPAARERQPVHLPELPAAVPEERRVIVKRVVVGDYYVPWPRASAPARVVVNDRARPAAPAKKAAPAKALPPTPSVMIERASRTAEDLRKSLWEGSRELDLETIKGTGKKLFEDSRAALAERKAALARGGPSRDRPAMTKSIRELVTKRDDLDGLPLLAEEACQSSAAAAKCLAKVSSEVRFLTRPKRPSSAPSMPTAYSMSPLLGWLHRHRDAHAREPLVARPLEQVFQVEGEEVRLALVRTLSAVPGREATRGLAARAVFDLSPEVRQAAIDGLKKRNADEARPVLLAALRYPWPAAADHAALALLELDDREAAPELEKIADGPDPCGPFKEGEKWYARELVRVNHLRNCLLCHAPATDRRDRVTGPIPEPGKRLPEFYYYSGGGSRTPSVRADIVYLRQDFSAMHKVAHAAPWPEEQRFDYLVRKRGLAKKEIPELPDLGGKAAAASPQRRAAREALAELKRRKAAVKE